MSASIKSLKSVSMVITRDQGGGPKKQGLVSSATGDSGLTVVQYNMTNSGCCQRWAPRYRPGQLQSSIPGWGNQARPNYLTRINGIVQM